MQSTTVRKTERNILEFNIPQVTKIRLGELIADGDSWKRELVIDNPQDSFRLALRAPDRESLEIFIKV